MRNLIVTVLLTIGVLTALGQAQQVTAATQPEWTTFTPVCEVRYVTPDGEFHARTDVTSVDMRHQWEKGAWDQIRFPDESRVIPVTLVQTPPC